MNSFTEILFSLAIRGTAVLIAAGLAALAMRRGSASMRRLVWIAASLCLLALPALTLLLPPIRAGHAFAGTPAAAVAGVVTVAPPVVVTIAKQPPRRTPWIPILWVTGVAVVLARLAAGMIRLTWLKRRSHAVDSIASVPCFESDRVTTPMTFGVFRPAILLPAGHQLWPSERLRLVRA